MGSSNSLPGRAELIRHALPDPSLEVGITLEAQFRRKPHDRGMACLGLFGKIGNRSEGEKRGIIQDGLSDASFGWCEPNADRRDAFLDRQIHAPC